MGRARTTGSTTADDAAQASRHERRHDAGRPLRPGGAATVARLAAAAVAPAAAALLTLVVVARLAREPAEHPWVARTFGVDPASLVPPTEATEGWLIVAAAAVAAVAILLGTRSAQLASLATLVTATALTLPVGLLAASSVGAADTDVLLPSLVLAWLVGAHEVAQGLRRQRVLTGAALLVGLPLLAATLLVPVLAGAVGAEVALAPVLVAAATTTTGVLVGHALDDAAPVATTAQAPAPTWAPQDAPPTWHPSSRALAAPLPPTDVWGDAR